MANRRINSNLDSLLMPGQICISRSTSTYRSILASLLISGSIGGAGV
jgi:hypothetical protein